MGILLSTQPTARALLCHKKFSEIRRQSTLVPELTPPCPVFTWLSDAWPWPQPERPGRSSPPSSLCLLIPEPWLSTLPHPAALHFPGTGRPCVPKALRGLLPPRPCLHRPWVPPLPSEVPPSSPGFPPQVRRAAFPGQTSWNCRLKGTLHVLTFSHLWCFLHSIPDSG